jgi:hypothetical protein
LRALQREHAANADQHAVQAAGEVNNVFISQGTDTRTPAPAEQKPSPAERRQEFHFDVLRLKMTHAQWMSFISVFAITVGLAVMIVGAVMAFM